MNRKTALQQAIYKISLYLNDLQPQTRERGIASAILSEVTALLPVERKSIEDAYYQGGDDVGTGEFGGTPAYNSPSDYFTQTYLSETGEVEQSDGDLVKSVHPEAFHFAVKRGYSVIMESEQGNSEDIGDGNDEQSAWSDAANRIRNSNK